jgi:hypothetical protein
MGFLDAILGRSKQKPAQLDALFALPGAAITLEAGAGLRPSGFAAVAFKPPAGQDFAQLDGELRTLLEMGARESGSELRFDEDRYGYRWVVLRDPQLEDLVTAVHMVNASLTERGYGPSLLCSVFGFDAGTDGHDDVYLVYLYKRGTFYPFAPLPGERRNNELELRVRGTLGADLPVEADLTRWFALWGIPQ